MNLKKFFIIVVCVFLSGLGLLFINPPIMNEIKIENGLENDQIQVDIDMNGFIKKASYKNKIFFNEDNAIQCGINNVYDWAIQEKTKNKLVVFSKEHNILRTYSLDRFSLTIKDTIYSTNSKEKFVLFLNNETKKRSDCSYIYEKGNKRHTFVNTSTLPLIENPNINSFFGTIDKKSMIIGKSDLRNIKFNNLNLSLPRQSKLNLYIDSQKSYLLARYEDEIKILLLPTKNSILNEHGVNYRDYGWISFIGNFLCIIIDWCAQLGSSGFLLYLLIFIILIFPYLILEGRKNKTGETGVYYYIAVVYMIFILFYTSTKAIPYCFDLQWNKFIWIKNLSEVEPNLLTLHGLFKISWLPKVGLLSILNGVLIYDQLDTLGIEDTSTKLILLSTVIMIFSQFIAANLLVMLIFAIARQYIVKRCECFFNKDE